jgi:hypothetical protein
MPVPVSSAHSWTDGVQSGWLDAAKRYRVDSEKLQKAVSAELASAAITQSLLK